jgi:hypothetical protein
MLSIPLTLFWLWLGQGTEPAKSTRPSPADGGHPQLSEEDLEVLMNLELLEHLGESEDLELMLALSGPG